jgi:hypothetical protein
MIDIALLATMTLAIVHAAAELKYGLLICWGQRSARITLRQALSATDNSAEAPHYQRHALSHISASSAASPHAPWTGTPSLLKPRKPADPPTLEPLR